jgi:hypothetical protein
MKSLVRTLSALSVSALLWPVTASADILAYDSFLYPDNSPLAGQSGGGGSWSSPWGVHKNIASATIQRGTLILGDGSQNPLVDPSKISSAYRSFTSYNGPRLFLKYTFMLGPGTGVDPDRVFVMLTGRGNGGGWGTLEVGTGLNHQFAAHTPEAKTDRRITARVYSTSSHRVANAVAVTDSTEYTVVVELVKESPRLDAPYSQFRLWVNPSASDYDSTPMKQIAYRQMLHTVNRVFLSVNETEPGDVIRFYDVMIATDWADVVTGDSAAPAP